VFLVYFVDKNRSYPISKEEAIFPMVLDHSMFMTGYSLKLHVKYLTKTEKPQKTMFEVARTTSFLISLYFRKKTDCLISS